MSSFERQLGVLASRVGELEDTVHRVRDDLRDLERNVLLYSKLGRLIELIIAGTLAYITTRL